MGSIFIKDNTLHEMIQDYFDALYSPYADDIKKSKLPKGNEIYGELYYYSFVQLLNNVKITKDDHFLDIGSGLGKIVFQVLFNTTIETVTGIEINHARHVIAQDIKHTIKEHFPRLLSRPKTLHLIEGDFLSHRFDNATIVYLCSTAFSYELLEAVGEKINEMKSAREILTFRKIPSLNNFKITKKIFLPATWDNVACYIYTRKSQ